MDATRARLSFEHDRAAGRLRWAAAAALVAFAVLLSLLIVRELRFAPRPSGFATESSATGVPSEAVSVPALSLAAGAHIRVGEPRVDAIAALGSMPLLGRAEERGPLGTREVRAYQGVTLVFEPFDRAGAPRVAAIYLQ